MMKNIINLFIIIFTLNVIVSCYQDRGNYDYTELNEVTINNDRIFGGKVDSVLALTSGIDTLRIYPDIKIAGNDQYVENLEYSWSLVNIKEGSVIDKETIALDIKTKNLEYPIVLPTNSYSVYLIIRDKLTDIEYRASWKINVKDLYSSGYLILSKNKDNYATLDMVANRSKDTIILYDISKLTGIPALKGPNLLFSGPSSNNEVYVCTDEGAIFLNKKTLTWNPDLGNLKYQIFASDLLSNYKVTQISDPYKCRHIIVDGYSFLPDLYGGCVCIYPTNRYPGKLETFHIADEFAVNFESFSANVNVFYNTDEKRFLVLSRSYSFPGAAKEVMDSLTNKSADVSIFDWKTGLDHVTTKHSYYGTGENFTLLTDNQGKYYMYRYEISSRAVTKKARYDVSDAIDIDKAKFFVFSANQPYFFYAVGSKIYGYDMQNGRKNSFSKDFGAEITLIDDMPNFGSTDKGTDRLFIATFDGTEKGGKIVKYQIENNPNKTELTSLNVSWEGFGRIVSMLQR